MLAVSTLAVSYAAPPPLDGVPTDGAAALVAGTKVAITQRFLDYARDLALPIGLQYLRTYPLPNPLANGDSDSISWKIENGKINSVNANAAITLTSPNVAGISITSLALSFTAEAHAREDVWPHPSVSGHVSAGCASSSHAALAISIAVDDQGIPTAALASCSADIDITDIHVSGLGILDKIADLIANDFKSSIADALKKAICQDGASALLNDALNPFLHSFKWQEALPLPAPFDKAELDDHLVGAPAVVSSGSATYLELALTAEILGQDGTRAPLTPVVLPHLAPSQLGARMVSVVLGEFPVNSALWTFWHQGALHYKFARADLPEMAQGILNTNDYRVLLMPKLYDAYPDTNMTLGIVPNTAPIWRVTPTHLSLSANTSLVFRVAVNATYQPLAFSLWTSFSATVHLNATASDPPGQPKLVGSVDDVNCELHAGALPFGGVATELVAALSTPANLALNYLVIPGLNEYLKKGIAIPPIDAALGGGVELTVDFVKPELRQFDGYLLLGTDANATLKKQAVRVEQAAAPPVEAARR